MTYQCINCLVKWITNNIETYDISHGLCKRCARLKLTPIYRKKQLLEGNFDCFAKSANFCDQLNCKYKDLCLIGDSIL